MEDIRYIIKYRKIVVWCFILLVLMAVCVIGINIAVVSYAESYIACNSSVIEPMTVALVPGAAVWRGGRLSHVLEDRVITALEMYRKGQVKKILASGDHGRRRYDEVNAMKKFFIDGGVRPRDLFLDHAGFDTYSSIIRARDVFGVRDMYIVTQRFHLHRSLFIARQIGVNAKGICADRRSYVFGAWYHLREVFARLKAVMNVLTKREPRFRGAFVPINGDGRASWD